MLRCAGIRELSESSIVCVRQIKKVLPDPQGSVTKPYDAFSLASKFSFVKGNFALLTFFTTTPKGLGLLAERPGRRGADMQGMAGVLPKVAGEQAAALRCRENLVSRGHLEFTSGSLA